MRLIGTITKIDTRNDSVSVPLAFFHRVALGLETGTTVFIAPVLPRKTGHSFVDELIISTFYPSWWSSMYRLSLRMGERQGAVADALRIIKSHNGNIGIMESVTTEAREGGTHDLLAFINITREEYPSLLADLGSLAKDITSACKILTYSC